MKNLVSQSFLALGLTLSLGVSAAGNVENGKALADAVCSSCHGPDGNSALPNFPKLAGLGEKYLLKQLRDIKNASAGGDPKKLSRSIVEMTGLLDANTDQELQDIAAYYAAQTLQLAGASQAEVQLNSGEKVDSLKLGAQVYRAGNLETGVPACSGCHSPKGSGNSPAGYPRLGGQHAAYIEKQLNDFRRGDRNNDGETMVMREVAKNMSEAEIKAVANFISGLN